MFLCLLYFALDSKVLLFKNLFLNLVLSLIASLTSFVTNLEWLAIRNLVFSGAILFKKFHKAYLILPKSKLLISRLLSFSRSFSKDFLDSKFL